MRHSANQIIISQEQRRSLDKIPIPLLSWYDKHARVLPWRQNPEPYWVWISEIMLQQTRVEAVIPYFHSFITMLPDISSLAQASEQILIKLWEGLGYYSRVRNLQKAAIMIMQQHQGQLPNNFEQLLKLPGIGEYTAGAIASIAYGQQVPAVDGNVLRVISRVLACTEDVSRIDVKRAFGNLLSDILPYERAGDFNQALMELGATICIPNGIPHCDRCPISQECIAYENENPHLFPVKPEKKARRIERRTVFVITAGDKVLLHKRPSVGLLSGLWEFLNIEGYQNLGEILEWLEQHGIQNRSQNKPDIQPIAKTKHIFTHKEWHMDGFHASLEHCALVSDCVWVPISQMFTEYAIPSAFKAYLSYLDRIK